MISLDDIPRYIGSSRYNAAYGGAGIKRFIQDYGADGGIDMSPEWQRDHVWTPDLQIRYIEHLLRGGEHGRTIVWNTPTQDANAYSTTLDRDLPTTLVLVDGKQRMTALLAFLNDELGVFGGNRLSDFDEQSQTYILAAAGPLRIQMNIHALQRKRDLLRLYLELNEGAVAHAPEELARVRAMMDSLQ